MTERQADHSIACGVFTNDDGLCTCKEAPSAATREPRAWVVRLGSYLRIFGKPAPGTLGYLTDARTGHLDCLIEKAKEREAEHGK